MDAASSFKQRLSTLRLTVHYLLEHAAAVGGEVFLPPDRRHSLDQARRDIAQCKADLRAYGVLVDDQLDDIAPPAVAAAAQRMTAPQTPPAPHMAATNADNAGNQGVQGAVYGPVTIHQANSPVAGPPAAPALQLRPPTQDFVGRDDVLGEILTALQPDTAGSGAVISGVRGMGGIGKTELALAVAARLRDTYADGHILLRLLGSGDTPLDPVQALQQVIQVFRPGDKLPDDLPALEALYHTTLSGRRVLILADDAHTPAQVRPLTPPLGCALLITTRVRFALDGMAPFDLDALPEPAAVTLLQRICPRLVEDQARRIATLCGRLPLALRISGGILLNDPALPVERYLRHLENERTRLAQLKDPDDLTRDVEAVLQVSYAKLDGPAQAVFRRLGVIGADADLALLSDVLRVPEKQLDELLRKLLKRYLVEYDQKTQRWGMHALVRVYALGQLTAAGADKERAARMRYAKRVIALIVLARQRYMAGRNGVLEGLLRFDQERAHLEAVRAWVWTQSPTADIDALVMAEADATAHLGELRDALRTVQVPQLERAIAAARRRGDRAAESSFLSNLGIAYRNLGEVRRAINLYEQSLAIVREVGDQQIEGMMLNNLGNAYSHLGEVRRAINLYEQSLAIAREVGNRHGGSNSLGNLGLAYSHLGEMRRALDLYEHCLAITREMGDRHGEGQVLGNLGVVYADLGNLTQALQHYDKSLQLLSITGDRSNESYVLSHLSCTYLQQGKPDEALIQSTAALALARDTDNRHVEGMALRTLASARAALGQPDEADANFAASLAVLEGIEHAPELARTRWDYGLFLIHQGEHERGLALLDACVAYEQQIGHAKATEHAAAVEQLRQEGSE